MENEFDVEELSPWVLRIDLIRQYMYDKQLTMFEIYSKLLKYTKDKKIYCYYTDDNSDKLIVVKL